MSIEGANLNKKLRTAIPDPQSDSPSTDGVSPLDSSRQNTSGPTQGARPPTFVSRLTFSVVRLTRGLTSMEPSMIREPNTTIHDEPFDNETVAKVWAMGRKELWFTFFKRDACGASIEREAYGQQTEYGWEIDHIVPVSKGGTDDLSNLQPLHWQNNRHKGDNHPNWECKLRW